MAWIIGLVTDEELKKLKDLGWEDAAPPEELVGEDEIRGVAGEFQTRAFFVDNDLFNIMTGPGWAQPKKKVRTLTIDETINEIAEVLRAGDGHFVENIANQVLVPKVTYDGDSLFTQEIAD